METTPGCGSMRGLLGKLGRDLHTRALVRAYLLAKQQVIASGFEWEIAWQEAVQLDRVTPKRFVREAAWVVLCAGMRESVVRGRFDDLGRVFGLWDPTHIARNGHDCRRRGQAIFNHPPKLDAIVQIAVELTDKGLDEIICGIQREGPNYLTRLPYIGQVTCFHLAKNLGCPVAKPDRHLERMAAALGYAGASVFCNVIAEALDEPVQVVDVVMWRFATINREYESWIRNSTAMDSGLSTATA